MIENKEDKKKDNWIDTPYKRAPWVPIKHSETIPPPNEQASNLDLKPKDVLQSRDEPVGSGSNAFPLKSVDPYTNEGTGARQKNVN